ncbi:hypothetical protein CcI156_17960 [Frankia sp. CcI156]|jgi:multisubunit Na+/H+ antiporter MnhB subunit|nr:MULTISPECIES: hypothetical protein [Frankia]ETA00820.1 hypothetical protein CcI6DRAFT_03761 [Frankia sp. CcI6]EYT91232.1 hypothetical protein ThrDRAFT_03159 [Frankia casuarinae]KFB03374.1 hypothetical protein ALLO2DRAFT_03878 [Frankia sp. Allo2]OAA21484.1 hypothetical protein AAY23_107623 [Frankia casuarinae]OFB42784.1 hypothetical protein Manayef4_13950 [Frankia sp. CgIM4]
MTLTSVGIVVAVSAAMSLLLGWYADLIRQALRQGHHREVRAALIAGTGNALIIGMIGVGVWTVVHR